MTQTSFDARLEALEKSQAKLISDTYHRLSAIENELVNLTATVRALKATVVGKIANPKVFFDLTVGGNPAGRIVMELYADKTPITAENFRALCTGEKGMGKFGKPLHYKGSIIDDIVVGSMWAGGDFIYGNAKGSESIYGGLFEDENFHLKHDRPGVLSMANCGENTNGSQFQIVLKKFPDIDGVHVVFGQVVQGLDVINSIGPEVKTRSGKPSKPVVIADCGEL